MKNRILSILNERCRLTPDELILVGVSGGPDSVCLLHILHDLGCRLIVAHLDHGIRSESSSEASFVRGFVEESGLDFFSETTDVLADAAYRKKSVEETARIARYQYLFRVANEVSADAVAVGHHADDQVETILMHMLRGSSLAGLRGMAFLALPNAWSDTIPLVRPLLSTWRDEIDNYIREHDLATRMDSSNLDRTYYRNRLRHELIPYLETYNPKIRKLIWQTGFTLQDDYDLVSDKIMQSWDYCVSEKQEAHIRFSLSRLRSQPDGIKRHLLREAITSLCPDLREITFELLLRAQSFILSPPESGQMVLIAGLSLLVEGDSLILVDQANQFAFDDPLRLGGSQPIKIVIPGFISLPSDWRLSAELIQADSEMVTRLSTNPDPYQGWFDLASLTLPLYVRTRKPGDRFMPLGMGGRSMKVSDFMMNVKLPRRMRESWPLVVMDKTIVWIPGYRIAELFKVTPHTRQVLHLVVEQKKK